MYIVTGGAGFIGSNLIAMLNERGIKDIVLVDDLDDGNKLANINDLLVADYEHKANFLSSLDRYASNKLKAVFHLGACSDTMEQDSNYMMENNYAYSRSLYGWCAKQAVPFIYASSAAVYGASKNFCERQENEKPLNIYGYSKYLFDQYVRCHPVANQVVGLRYFNVYGPRESHKGRMASVAFHHYQQLCLQGYVTLFVGSHGYANGEQCRDFVYVRDVVAAKLHFFDNPHMRGIFNLGTGKAQTFNQLALAGVNAWRDSRNQSKVSFAQAVDEKYIRYIPFPEGLASRYQAFTQADIRALRASGFALPFTGVDQAVSEYHNWLAHTAST